MLAPQKVLKLGSVALFALLLLVVTVAAGWRAGAAFYDMARSRDWVAVDAVASSPKTYRYEFGGRTYEGWRQFPGHYMRAMDTPVSEAIEEAFETGATFAVWVDPREPSEALAGRDAAWFAASDALIAFVSAAVACFAIMLVRARWHEPDAAFVDPPRKYTTGEKTRGLIGLWVLTAFFLVISVPWAATIVYRAAAQSEWIALIELFFLPIPAFALLAYAIVLTRRRKRGPSPTTHGSRASLG